jgi:hypothetical protein
MRESLKSARKRIAINATRRACGFGAYSPRESTASVNDGESGRSAIARARLKISMGMRK